MHDELIDVTSTQSTSIPAEKELTRSPEGHKLLRRFRQALFDSCRHVLQARSEKTIGARIIKHWLSLRGKNTSEFFGVAALYLFL